MQSICNIFTRLWNDLVESFLLMRDVTWHYVSPRWRVLTLPLWLFFPVVFLMAVIVSWGVNDCGCGETKALRPISFSGEYIETCPKCGFGSKTVKR